MCSHSKGDIFTCEDIKFSRESSPGIYFIGVYVINTVTMVQKCRRNQAPPYLCNLFHDRFGASGRSTRNMSQLNLPKCRLSTVQRSFAFRGAKEYNLLPENIRNLNNISRFTRKVAAHFLANSS